MSYAGPHVRRDRAADVTSINAKTPVENAGGSTAKAFRPLPRYSTQSDRTTIFAAGLALGLALGAGAALLFAPQSGADTRQSLARRSRRLKRRSSGAWDDLQFELRQLRRQLQRKSLRRRAASSL
jgi:hypothetical protein